MAMAIHRPTRIVRSDIFVSLLKEPIQPPVPKEQRVNRKKIAVKFSQVLNVELPQFDYNKCLKIKRCYDEFMKIYRKCKYSKKVFIHNCKLWLEESFSLQEWPDVFEKPTHNQTTGKYDTPYTSYYSSTEIDSSPNSSLSELIPEDIPAEIEVLCSPLATSSNYNILNPTTPKRKTSGKSPSFDKRTRLSSDCQPTILKPFSELSKSGKTKRTKNIADQYELHELASAMKRKLNSEYVSYVLDKIVDNPEICRDIKETLVAKKPICMTASEGLGLLIDLDISHANYQSLQNSLHSKNVSILPSLKRIQEEKDNCIPKNITNTETLFQVDLQSMQDHTLQRLSGKIKEPILKSRGNLLTMISKIGFDGQSGREPLNVKVPENENSKFESILHTAVSPLELTDAHKNVIWSNPTPSSCFTCRPLRMAWEKETRESINAEYMRLVYEIENLEPTEICVDGKNYLVYHEILFTMLDGKSISALTNTPSSQTCPNCKAKPNDFEIYTKNPSKYPVHVYTLDFGMSPLHMYLRALEWILNIAYRLEIKVWKITKDRRPTVKNLMLKIKEGFKKHLNLIVGRVNKGAGTSNTGNVARKIFDNPNVTADITGVDVRLISNIATMLSAINSGFRINVETYQAIGSQTAELAYELYSWYKMPQSMHRLCYHVADYVSGCPVTIGQTSEEAIETSHKMALHALKHHSRQHSYKTMTGDMARYRLMQTDPQINGHYTFKRLGKKVSKPFSQEVRNLLESSLPATAELEIFEEDDNTIEIRDFMGDIL